MRSFFVVLFVTFGILACFMAAIAFVDSPPIAVGPALALMFGFAALSLLAAIAAATTAIAQRSE